MLEGAEPNRSSQLHLDRCLTCRNCETTCPSGVEYGALVDIGRKLVDDRVERPAGQKVVRGLLRWLLNSSVFGPALAAGRVVWPMLPAVLRNKVPPVRLAGARPRDRSRHARQMLMLQGCVQPAMAPFIDAATMRVLDAIGVGTRMVRGATCCGAIHFHLDAQEQGRAQMRVNIDAWLPLLDSGEAEALVMNASGCGAMVREYAHHLRHDRDYAAKALRLVNKVMDVAEVVAPHTVQLKTAMDALPPRVVFHPPCTLQHWQGLRYVSERVLEELGFALQPFGKSHLCCGSAGAYSVTAPGLAASLRERKLANLNEVRPDFIVSSNMGCVTHLQAGTRVPVRHWIEVVDTALAATR